MPDQATVAVLVSVVSVAIAYAAAIWARHSAEAAKRSADAAERQADAAEKILALENDRKAREESDRAEAGAPKVDVGDLRRTHWVLAQGGRALVGFVQNRGPGSLLLERVHLSLEGEVTEADISARSPLLIEAGEQQQIAVPWSLDVDPRFAAPKLGVTFAAADSDYRGLVTFTLLRNGNDLNGQPQWRQGEVRVQRL